MSWNYRVCVTKIEDSPLDGENQSYGIYEVFYTEEGRIKYVTEAPIAPYGSTYNSLKTQLDIMSSALSKEIINLDTLRYRDEEEVL